jgi:hypothetical protein
MEISSMKKNGRQLVITLELGEETELSFLEKEETFAQLLNEVGVFVIGEMLCSEDVKSGSLEHNGVRYYAKSCQKKSMKALMVR